MTIEEKEEPLDPAVEAIRVKMVRLLFVSGGIMMLGLMAVLAAIVYKINRSPVGQGEASPVAAVVRSADLAVPGGATLLSSSATSDGLLLTLKLANGKTVLRRYNSAGTLLSEYSVIEE